VVTHDPRAASYAGRVIFLRDGDIVKEYKPGDDISLTDRMNGIMSTMRELES
jgi:putative ABC transport system ATP-binding protein